MKLPTHEVCVVKHYNQPTAGHKFYLLKLHLAAGQKGYFGKMIYQLLLIYYLYTTMMFRYCKRYRNAKKKKNIKKNEKKDIPIMGLS